MLTQGRISVNVPWKKWPQYQLKGNSFSFGLMGFVKGCDTIHTSMSHADNDFTSAYSVSVVVLGILHILI